VASDADASIRATKDIVKGLLSRDK